MTTLNTIIEEEKEYKVFDCFEDGCGECEVCEYLSFREWAEGCAPQKSVIERSEIIEDYLKRKDVHTTSAMQRAYEAGREERDTYWKERVRKTVGKIEESARTQDTSYEYGEGTYEGMMHSIFILKDITNEDNLK